MRASDAQQKIQDLAPLLDSKLLMSKFKEYERPKMSQPAGRMSVPGRRLNGPRRGHHLMRGSDMPKGTPGRGVCSIEGCERQHLARGWCVRHYSRWTETGDPMTPSQRDMTPAERFALKVNKDGPVPEYAPALGPCWLWTGARSTSGYGSFWSGQRQVPAHRWSYEQVHGAVQSDLYMDHLCRVPSCVNPAHLEPVTQSVNIRRGLLPDLIRQPGVSNPCAKLNDESVREIRRLHAGGMSQSALAIRYGVARRTIGFAVKRSTWSHVQ